jgi:hypothetical protein
MQPERLLQGTEEQSIVDSASIEACREKHVGFKSNGR